MSDKEPPNLPKGVRFPSTITTRLAGGGRAKRKGEEVVRGEGEELHLKQRHRYARQGRSGGQREGRVRAWCEGSEGLEE